MKRKGLIILFFIVSFLIGINLVFKEPPAKGEDIFFPEEITKSIDIDSIINNDTLVQQYGNIESKYDEVLSELDDYYIDSIKTSWKKDSATYYKVLRKK